MTQFVMARNPEPDSRLPCLLWVPLGQRGVLCKAAAPGRARLPRPGAGRLISG